MTWEAISRLRSDLTSNITLFRNMMQDNVSSDIDSLKLSIKEYERRINVSLELQYVGSYIVSILYQMINIIKDKVRKGGSQAEQSQNKRTYEELNSLLEEYKSHVYTYSQRAKCLTDLMKTKQMASPELYRNN